MPTRKDILIWRAVWSPIILNIRTLEMPSVQEASSTALTERTNPTVAAIWIVARPLSVPTVAVNVWAATL